MKTKIICSLFLLFFLTGCRKEPQYELYENHNISACGIVDPLKNLPWLKAYCSEHYNSYSTTVSIYINNTSGVNHIVILNTSAENRDRDPSIIWRHVVYTCEGVGVLFNYTEGTVSEGWDAFFLENTLVAKIWEVKEN